MVVHHEDAVSLLYGGVVGFVYHSDYQLGLPQGHLGVETSSVHCLGVQVAAVADVSVHSESPFYAWIII